MIKIIKAHENSAIEGFTVADVHILIDIDAHPLHIGGINPAWDRDTLMQWLNGQHAHLLEQALQATPDEPVVKQRLDLIAGDVMPKSIHVAVLKSISMVNGSPRATVVRKYLGLNYEVVNCRVSQTAFDYYQAGKIKLYDTDYELNDPENKDSFVTVKFITENPYDEEVQIPIVDDKVIK